MTETLEISPVSGPITGSMRPPGSKSLTNRALIVAALAQGKSTLSGILDSTDTRVMLESLSRLGMMVHHDNANSTATLSGCAGALPTNQADLWLENSGTSIRFLTALCTLGIGTFRLDGNQRMRERPIRDLGDALNLLGANVSCENNTDCPPVIVRANELPGGRATVAGNISSQFLSALLLVAPAAKKSVELQIEHELVSRPYIEMTVGVMSAFGVTVDSSLRDCYLIKPQTYKAREYAIEPDASAASYFFAAAAITGGSVTVEGLSRDALQGDIAFVDVLEQMGCQIDWSADSVTVHGGKLTGVDVDMNAISDTAQTLAAIAPFAAGPTRIRNVAHMRHKETDRVSAVAAELNRIGIQVEEYEDGMTIHPGSVQPAVIETYDDHRMAMSFALVGLRSPGIKIADPGCTSKTYPHFFDDLRKLCETA